MLTPSDPLGLGIVNPGASAPPIAAHKQARLSQCDSTGRVVSQDLTASAEARSTDRLAEFRTRNRAYVHLLPQAGTQCIAISGRPSFSALAPLGVLEPLPLLQQPRQRCIAYFGGGLRQGLQCQAPATRPSQRWGGWVCGTHDLGGLPPQSEEKKARARERAAKSRRARKELERKKKEEEAAAQAARAARAVAGGPGVSDSSSVDILLLDLDLDGLFD